MNIASFSSEALAAPGTPGTVPASPCTRFNSRAADRATVSNAAAGGSSLSFFLLFGEKKKYIYGEREGGDLTQCSGPTKPPGGSEELRKASLAPRIGTKGGRGPESRGVAGRGMPCAASRRCGWSLLLLPFVEHFSCSQWKNLWRCSVVLPRGFVLKGRLYGGAFI